MDEQLKRRLIGATVLIALAIIFLPMLLSHKPVARHSGKMMALPVEPERNFDAGLLENIPSAFTADSAEMAVPATATEQTSPITPAVEEKPKSAAKSEPITAPSVMAAEKPKPQKSVEKKAVSSAKAPLSAWVVQVASFSSRNSAEKLVKKLRKAGFDTMNPIPVTVGGKRYYRVQVGPELEKQRTRKMLPKINKIAGAKGQVVRYP